MRMRGFGFLAYVWSLFLGMSSAYGHGEDKPGPNGGHIRMPASFHTELVMEASGTSFKVYLSNVRFADADTKSSEISVVARTSGGDLSVPCSAKGDHFLCSITKDGAKKLEQLRVTAKYKDQPRATAIYKFPLQDFAAASALGTSQHTHPNSTD